MYTIEYNQDSVYNICARKRFNLYAFANHLIPIGFSIYRNWL